MQMQLNSLLCFYMLIFIMSTYVKYLKTIMLKSTYVILACHETLKMWLPSSIISIIQKEILMIEIKDNGNTTLRKTYVG